MTSHFPLLAPDDHKQAYLDLLKRSLMGWPFAKLGYKVTENERLEGKDWPDDALTLLSLSRLNNIQECIETVLKDNVPGDLMECGVWRGGACIFMRGVLHIYGSSKYVFMADSFQGVPPPTNTVAQDANLRFHDYGYLAVTHDEVIQNFERYGLNSGVFSKIGLFKDTLVTFRRPLSLLRIDGDLYESTMDCLVNLYQCVSPGGYVIIDDYVCFPHVRAAVDEFRERNTIKEEIAGVDWSAVYWRKA